MSCGFVCSGLQPAPRTFEGRRNVSVCRHSSFLPFRNGADSNCRRFTGNLVRTLHGADPRYIHVIESLAAGSNTLFVCRKTLVMVVSNGSRFPEEVTFMTLVDGQVKEIKAGEIFNGKKVVIFGVPGAFTPSCSDKHLPGFAESFEKFKEKGIDTVACLAANDPYVMHAWAKQKGVEGKIVMLSDGNGSVLEELGLSVNTGNFGGRRARRFSAYVENGVVKNLNLESGTAFTEVSAAERVLSQI
eukprot:jgi/Galph1/43/GphlegSOOS_G4823.1